VRALLVLAAALAGVLSGAAGTLLHQHWWGMGLALVAGVTALAWLPPGAARVLYALGWCVPVLRGALPRPAGGFLVGADAAGWSFLAGSAVLLMAALATVRSRTPAARGGVEDPGDRGRAT